MSINETNQEDDFDEYEGIYDELNLDEEEEKFGLVAGEDDSDNGSEDESEGMGMVVCFTSVFD
jgi:CCR4-NOT transcription complex subunit 3